MRILMVAYACEPDAGGEPSVGWNWAKSAAMGGHHVTVLTRENNGPSIRKAMQDLPLETQQRIAFVYHDLHPRLMSQKKKFGIFSMLGYYYVWQLAAIPKLASLEKNRKFDLAQHVTFCNDSIFSVLALLKSPFILAPTGGYTHKIPRFINVRLSRRARSYELKRRSLQFALRYLDPLAFLTRRRARKIITYSEEALAAYRGSSRRKVIAMRHVGVDRENVMPPKAIGENGVLKIVTAGRLVHWKGFDLALESVAIAIRAGVEIELEIIGEGPEGDVLRDMANALGLNKSVTFSGRLPSHADVLRRIRQADVYLQPTLRDGPPVAILEAMSVGTLVVTADFGANRELVPANCGVVVAARGSREQLVSDLAAGLKEIHQQPDKYHSIVENCTQEVLRHRTWEAIGHTQLKLYSDLEGEWLNRDG